MLGVPIQLLCAKDAYEEAWPMKVVLHCSECMPDQDQHGYVLLECDIIVMTQLTSPSASCVDYCMACGCRERGKGCVHLSVCKLMTG